MRGQTSSVPPARPRAALIFPFLWVLTFDHNIWPRRAVLEASVSCRVKPGLGSRIRCGMGKKCKLLILQVMFLGPGIISRITGSVRDVQASQERVESIFKSPLNMLRASIHFMPPFEIRFVSDIQHRPGCVFDLFDDVTIVAVKRDPDYRNELCIVDSSIPSVPHPLDRGSC